MGETIQVNKNEFDKEELSEYIKSKILEYLMENENALIVKTLVLHINLDNKNMEKLIDNTARTFVGLKKGILNISVNIYNTLTYDYNMEDMTITDAGIWGPFYLFEADFVLPNKVKIASVEVHVSSEKYLYREIYNEVQTYKDILRKIVEYLKEAIKQKAEELIQNK